MNIIKYNEFDISKLKYKKIVSLSKTYSTKSIAYNDGDLLIQTPVLNIPFMASRYNTLDISFTNTIDNNDIKSFYDSINSIIENAKSKYKRKFIDNIIKSVGYQPRLRCNLNNDISCFDKDKNNIDYEIHCKTYARFIIHVNNLWIKTNKYGINFDIKQIQYHTINSLKLDTYAFKDEEDRRLEKYKKMLKMKIPEQAVKNKMMLDNLDPSLLFGKTEERPKMSFLNDIKKKPQLKKVETKINNDEVEISNGFKINLLDIKNAISNLKKSNK